MVKVTVGEMSYEGTAEEIKELFEVLGAEFPSTPEATEESVEEEDLSHLIGKYVVFNERKGNADKGDVLEISGISTYGSDRYLKYEINGNEGDVLYPPHKSGYDYEIKDANLTSSEFKDGDIAVVTGRTRCGYIPKGSKVRLKHSGLDGDGEIEVEFLDESDYDWAKPEALELVVDDEETTLKNGDKVRLLHGGNEGSAQGFYNGKIYEVVDVNWIVRDGEHRVCIGEVDGTNEGYVDIEQLEKVLEGVTEQVPTEEIEVGDIIRREGKFHEVEGVREPGYMCSSEGLTTTDGRWMFIDTVELVAKKSDRKDV